MTSSWDVYYLSTFHQITRDLVGLFSELSMFYQPRDVFFYLRDTICCLLTHWGRVTHICVGNLTTIGSDNGLSPGRRQAIILTNDGILLIGPLWTNFSEILIEIPTFSFMKMDLKVSSAKWRPFCLGLNVLIDDMNVDIGIIHLKSFLKLMA